MATELHPQYLTDSAGNKAFVVLTVEEYEDLIEDLHDLAVMAARRDDPRMSLDQFEERLRNDGLL
jgi:PHD/YefM family antitoxin component YafN of YafNO toxin-antitoxin module